MEEKNEIGRNIRISIVLLGITKAYVSKGNQIKYLEGLIYHV
jgi:hypothetical protein